MDLILITIPLIPNFHFARLFASVGVSLKNKIYQNQTNRIYARLMRLLPKCQQFPLFSFFFFSLYFHSVLFCCLLRNVSDSVILFRHLTMYSRNLFVCLWYMCVCFFFFQLISQIKFLFTFHIFRFPSHLRCDLRASIRQCQLINVL